MRRAVAALTLLTAHAANIASELEAFVDAAAAPAQTAQSAAPAHPAQSSDRVVFVKPYKTGSPTVSEFLAQIGYERGLHALPPSASRGRAAEVLRQAHAQRRTGVRRPRSSERRKGTARAVGRKRTLPPP